MRDIKNSVPTLSHVQKILPKLNIWAGKDIKFKATIGTLPDTGHTQL